MDFKVQHIIWITSLTGNPLFIFIYLCTDQQQYDKRKQMEVFLITFLIILSLSHLCLGSTPVIKIDLDRKVEEHNKYSFEESYFDNMWQSYDAEQLYRWQ